LIVYLIKQYLAFILARSSRIFSLFTKRPACRVNLFSIVCIKCLLFYCANNNNQFYPLADPETSPTAG
jgi:hypothetical protein